MNVAGFARRMLPLGCYILAVLYGCAPFQPKVVAPAETSGRTSPEIRAGDLKVRLEAFAHDSMLGRRSGTEGGARAERYLASAAAELGLIPAGEDGMYFQPVPLVRYALDDTATALRVDGVAPAIGDDFAPFPPAGPMRSIEGQQAIFGGSFLDGSALSANQIAGRVVIIAPRDRGAPIPDFSSGPLAQAAAVVVIDSSDLRGLVRFLKRSPTPYLKNRGLFPARILTTPRAAAAIMGKPVDSATTVGTEGRRVVGRIVFSETPLPSRNVVALLPGSDPRLRMQYVVLSAHADGLGTTRPLNHDSVRAVAAAQWERELAGGSDSLPAVRAEAVAMRADTILAPRPARQDSVLNGADDNASGAVALLEIAETLTRF